MRFNFQTLRLGDVQLQREREKETERGRRRKSLGRGQTVRLPGRIMRTNANSRSLRCGQAFICHALAIVYSCGQYGTYASLRVVVHSLFLLLDHLRLASFSLEFPRRPQVYTLPQLSATVILRVYFCSRIAPPPHVVAVACTFLLIMQYPNDLTANYAIRKPAPRCPPPSMFLSLSFCLFIPQEGCFFPLFISAKRQRDAPES